ncbi:phosphatidylinositol synthase [Hyaloraphidium curvatum]|nr:phosphatidylinositol synthase [Hyaloraphidium curvatum]
MATTRRRAAAAAAGNGAPPPRPAPPPPNVYLFIPNLIGYARVLLCALSLWALPAHPMVFFWSYAASALLDAVDGYAARYFGQSTKFGAVLDMVTDRSSTTCLLTYLASIYPHFMLMSQFLIALDLSSHYMHMVSSLTSGANSHKIIADTGNPLLKLYYSNKYVLFLVCFGNESFFILFYMMHALPAGFLLTAVKVCSLITLPVCVLKQLLNVIQLWAAAEALVHVDEKEWMAAQRGEAVAES